MQIIQHRLVRIIDSDTILGKGARCHVHRKRKFCRDAISRSAGRPECCDNLSQYDGTHYTPKLVLIVITSVISTVERKKT